MKVSLCQAAFRCKSCGTIFSDFALSQDTSSQLIFYNRLGRKKYWDTLTDKDTFEEFKRLFDNTLKLTTPTSKNTTLFHFVLGMTCDDENGDSPYKDRPFCPTCRSYRTQFMSFAQSPNCREMDIELATHRRWNLLSALEKERLLHETVNRINVHDL